MRLFRHLIVPAASFVIAWIVADYASDRSAKGAEDDAADVLPLRERLTARSGMSGRQRVEQLHRDFHDQPISEWNRLWDGFARETDFETLKKLAEFPPTGDDGYVLAERNVLQVLSREELAVRSGRVEVPAPEAFAALAEVDAAAAWRDLERHYQSDHAMAAFRSLALRDPVGTYKRFQSMPPAPEVPSQYTDDLLGENRSGILHTPLGAIFGAWARKDPQAAAEVARKLPLRVRREAVGKLAISWAYQDGPAALRFLVDSGAIYQSSAFGEIRMDVILRASFRSHPAATARIVAEHRVLREFAGDMRVVKPWYEADPDAVIAWILEGERMPEEDSTNQTEYNRGRASILYSKLRGENQADLIRRLAAAGSISSVASEDPGKVTHVEVEDAPAVLCDRWLEALRLDGDPDRSLAAIGLGEYQGMKLLVLAAVASPERAEEFAKLIPKEWMKERIHHHNEWFLGPFWPELVSKRPSKIVYKSASDMKSLVMDPAAALEGSEVSKATPRHVEHVLTISAPYAPEEAGEWVRRLPAGLARHHGEWLLLVAQARENPEALLRFVADHPGFKPVDTNLYDDVGLEGFHPLSNGSKIGVCLNCLRQMRVKGGDWKGWMEQMPMEVLSNSDLTAEAELLDFLERGAASGD